MTDHKFKAKAEATECKFGAKCANGNCKYVHVLKPMKMKTAVVPATVKSKLNVHHVIHMGRSLVRRKAALDAMSLAPAAPKGYFMVVDSKSAVAPDTVSALKELYDSELRFAKEAIGKSFGSKPMRIVLPYTVQTQFVSTVTTGVMAVSISLDASLAPEFASCAALFDEYRFESGKLHYFVVTPTSTVVLATSTLSANAMWTIGYDPADGTAPTSVLELTQLQQHEQLSPRMMPTPTAGTYVGVYGRQDNKPFLFSWRIQKYAAYTGNGGAVGPGDWKATAGNVSNFPDGSLKAYYATGETTVKQVAFGTLDMHLEFRSRT